MRLGRDILSCLGGATRLHKGFLEQAGFVVLKSPDTPSLLIETGFLSNAQEEILLRDPCFQRRLAAAVVRGLNLYFRRFPPPGTWYEAHSSVRH